MKNKITKKILLLIIIVIVSALSYMTFNAYKNYKTVSGVEKVDIANVQKTEVTNKKKEMSSLDCFEDFKRRNNSTSDKIADYFTKYNDGRESEIRSMQFYDGFNCGLNQEPQDQIKINLIVVEWNINKGVVVTEDSAFANQDNNYMDGGDVESNRLITPSAKQFMQNGKLFFDNDKANLTKIEKVPNRNIDEVSFDFITNQGIFTIKEKIDVLRNRKSELSIFFKEAEELKLKTEKVVKRKSIK